MLRTIHLYGHLKKKFGASHRFDVKTASEALRALNCAFPGEFVEALKTGSYTLVRGAKRTGIKLDIDLICKLQLGAADIHLIPAAAGAANNTKGIVKTVLGVVLIGAAIFMSGGALAAPLAGLGTTAFEVAGMSVTWGNIAMVGLGVALSGAATLISNATTTDPNKTDSSYSINGPSNGAQQGGALQLIYGEIITGSQEISFDADIEDIDAYAGVSSIGIVQGGGGIG